MPGKPQSFRSARQGAPGQYYEAERGSARKRGYDARWDKVAALEKQQKPLCLGCKAVGRLSPTEVIDHIIPHKGNVELFWDQANWQPACGWHHDVVKQTLEQRYAKAEIKAADLRLDSTIAIALTRELMALPAKG